MFGPDKNDCQIFWKPWAWKWWKLEFTSNWKKGVITKMGFSIWIFFNFGHFTYPVLCFVSHCSTYKERRCWRCYENPIISNNYCKANIIDVFFLTFCKHNSKNASISYFAVIRMIPYPPMLKGLILIPEGTQGHAASVNKIKLSFADV